MRLPVTVLNSSLFTYTKKLFVTEASDLYGYDTDKRIWDDAADVGFEMLSDRTGKKMIFTFSKTIYDNEGEVIAWEYVPYNVELLNSGVKAHILND